MPTADVNGISMYYEIRGSGEPLILIPGLGSDIARWTTTMDVLAGKYRVTGIDNRGCGRTDKPDTRYTIELMAEDTLGLMDALGIESAHIIGLSMGAQVAQALAFRYPGRVKRIVLVAASSRVAPDDPQREGPVATSLRRWLGFWLVRRIFARYPATKASIYRQIDAVLAFDSRPWIGRIPVPTLIVNGKNDPSITVQQSEELARGIPGARLVLFPGDHLTIGRRPETWSGPAIGFLGEKEA